MNKSEINISVVVPVYNAERYLPACVESILHQTLRPREAIFIDDGSSDKSREILCKYREENPWITVLAQPNQGAPAARNNGLKKCTGDYILFFDADDVLRENALELLLNGTDGGSADIVFGVRKYDLRANDAEVRRKYRLDGSVKRFTRNIPERLYSQDPLPGNKLYRREFLAAHDIHFSDLAIGQDLNFFLKSLFCARKACFVNSLVMDYRISEGGISRIYKLDKIMAIKESIDDAENFVQFHQNTYGENEIKKVMDSSRVINYSVQAEKLKRVDGFMNRMKGYAFFDRNSRSFLWDRRKLIYTNTMEIRRRKLIKYLIFRFYLAVRK